MTDPGNLSGAQKPPLRARLVFAAACELNLTMLVTTNLLLGFCLASPVLLAALGEQDAARIVLVITGLATFAWFVAGMLFVAPLGGKAASPAHIAAALHAATVHEREHLLRQMRDRVENAYCTDPLTIDELALLFRSVWEEHGERARQRADRQDRAKRAQRDFVTGLAACETGREAPQEPR